MEYVIICTLIIASILLFLIELFFIPGVSLAGISALVCITYAIFYAFIHLGANGGFITLTIAMIAFTCTLIKFMRSKTLDRLSLKKEIDSSIDRSAAKKLKIGDTGYTTTRLAQIGYADFNGDLIEVKSMEGFINEKTPIRVSRIIDGVIIVEEIHP